MEWFKVWFSSKFYLELYRHRNEEDARNLINLIQRNIKFNSGEKALDICCGAGRHSLELARRGCEVTGFDLSDYLIKEARKNLQKSPEKNLKAKFLIKDMRNFNFKNSFDLAVNLFTSFGYFENEYENIKVIKNVSSSLKRGGYFVFDHINKNNLQKNIIPFSRNKYGNSIMIQKREISGNYVIKNITIKNGTKRNDYQEKLRLYSEKELNEIFSNAGLKIYKKFGDYFGNNYSEKNSPRMILFSKKL
ncbi:MAG TPA: class I SAM-dependent methyltransferase [Ignavibacteria bacterium]|nr:class I SAM-dependent methyltransferase [Ignavibacteria bacterium]